MPSPSCFGCYGSLDASEQLYHARCSRKLFGSPVPPALPFTELDILDLAEQSVLRSATVAGAQTKLSLGLISGDSSTSPDRFTILGVWGSHILKPPTPNYPYMVELEDLTMHLAELSGIRTVPHGLLPMQDGTLAYITRRVDRLGKPGGRKMKKLHMEDLCQLTERMTEHKYRGSHEQIAKAIQRFTTNPQLDVITFYEQVLFSFLTGNADMHLKNFSLLKDADGHYNLSPAYDLVPSTLLINETEELALTLNGRKSKLTRNDFETAMRAGGLNERAIANLFTRFAMALPKWKAFIPLGFVPEELKVKYVALIGERAARMGL
ncbi:MAG: HipA domain-containing protein [Flavobacteriales bacterium]|nr:HipA domain-containing protein [Flavobacteriales bacterium]